MNDNSDEGCCVVVRAANGPYRGVSMLLLGCFVVRSGTVLIPTLWLLTPAALFWLSAALGGATSLGLGLGRVGEDGQESRSNPNIWQ